MTNSAKKYLAIVLSIAVCIGVFGVLFGAMYCMAYDADDANYFSAEQYTDSDWLLNADGSYCKKDITDFSYEVKAAKNNEVISDNQGDTA